MFARSIVITRALLLVALVSPALGIFGGETPAHGADGHSHASAHGGVLMPIGGNHAEWVFDAASGSIDLYVLGADESKPAPIDAADLTAQIKLKTKDSFTAVKLTAKPLAGEKAGAASRFSGQNDSLKGAAEMEAVVHVPIDGKRFRAKFDWKPGAGDGHGHTHAESGPASVTAAVKALQPLMPGVSSPMLLTLNDKNGKPVSFDDLEVVHTRRIHLLIVDPSLTDYQHLHPVPGERAGEYTFNFTPVKAGSYKVFADLLPKATHRQEYAPALLDVAGTGLPVDRTTNLETTVDGLKFVLTFDRAELKANEALAASVSVFGADGKTFTQLEPVMGAFAHAVAFDEKRASTVHIHPLGREPEQESERGGPKLDFHMKFAEAGFWKLYIQVQVNGKDVFAPFGLKLADSTRPQEVASKTLNNKVCPITGKPVHSMQADAHLIFKDTRIELCCTGCEKTFMDAPNAAWEKATAK